MNYIVRLISAILCTAVFVAISAIHAAFAAANFAFKVVFIAEIFAFCSRLREQ